MKLFSIVLAHLVVVATAAFQVHPTRKRGFSQPHLQSMVSSETDAKTQAEEQKQKLLGLIGKKGYIDEVLADPDTKEPVRVITSGVWLGGEPGNQKTKFELIAGNVTYRGASDTYLNLLELVESNNSENNEGLSKESQDNALMKETAKRLLPFIPPPFRSPLATAGFPVGDDYIPMRDLFTSPSVSFAYERGWRQGFQRAGFPGPDKEAELANEFFAPVAAEAEGSSVLVDMSCATGKFCYFKTMRNAPLVEFANHVSLSRV